MTPPKETKELRSLHRKSFGTAQGAKQSTACACFHCISVFPGASIVNVIVERDKSETALCPLCGIDAVLPGEIDVLLLQIMNQVYFTPINRLN